MFLIELQIRFMGSWKNLSCAAFGIRNFLRTSAPWSIVLHEKGSWLFTHWWWGLVDCGSGWSEELWVVKRTSDSSLNSSLQLNHFILDPQQAQGLRHGSWVGVRNSFPFLAIMGLCTCTPTPVRGLVSSSLWRGACMVQETSSLLCLPDPLTAWCRLYLKATPSHSLTSTNEHCAIAQD